MISATTCSSHSRRKASLLPKWWMTSAALTSAASAIPRTDVAANPSRPNRAIAASRIRARVVTSSDGAERMFNMLNTCSAPSQALPAPVAARLAQVSDIEIGRAKRARRAYAFDDIAIVPTRRTRDPQDVSRQLDDRRVHVRHPGARRTDGLGRQPGDGDRDRQARRPRRARPRGRLDPLRRPRAGARGDPRRCPPRAPPSACRRSTPSRSSPS